MSHESDRALTEHRPTTTGPALSGGALLDALDAEGRRLGFARVGVTSAIPHTEARERLETWLARGYDGGLDYMRGADRADPRALFPGAKSVVVAALAYPAPSAGDRNRGHVAAYARGEDYHLVMKRKLAGLADALANLAGTSLVARIAVDTAPLLERALAARAGLGFIGKSTLLIVPGAGTHVVLGELLVDLELAPHAPAALEGCGSCRACLDACPTGAILEPFVVDAALCISHATIENPDAIRPELRERLGTRVFGCDECQAVCPFDRAGEHRPSAPELSGRIPPAGLDLVRLLTQGNAGYRSLVKRTALRRVTRDTLARNAALALGNARDSAAVPHLVRALAEHPSAIVRAHAAWALGQLGTGEARAALERAASDSDPSVAREARLALGRGAT